LAGYYQVFKKIQLRLKTNKDMAPQSQEILQTFEWWGSQTAKSLLVSILTNHSQAQQVY